MDSNQNKIEVTLMRHVDRISTLPDDIISNRILSLLPTKDSVRTSVLSTRWKHLYAFVPVLYFPHATKHLRQSDPPFAGFVSKVLNTVTNNLSSISKFYIYLEDTDVISSDITSWIDIATSHSVQSLDVYGYRVESAVMPHSLFTCETLVSLSLDLRFVLSVPDKVCLPKLKNLWLKNFILKDASDDESVRRLLSSCPVLESLMMFSSSMPNARVFNVAVPSLKVLSLYLWDTSIELSINCPNLEKLNCGSYAARGFFGDVLGSLKECEIDVAVSSEEQFEEGKLIELVRQVCNVQSLSLNGDSMQSLLFPLDSLPVFENLTHLELESDAPDGWQLLPSILDSSPCLKTLDFRKGFFDIDINFGNPFPLPEHVPVCLSFHLKVIKFGRFAGEEDEYQWVEYFLLNALVLEKMEICLWFSEGSEEENDPTVDGDGEGEGEEDGEGEEEGDGDGEGEEQFDADLVRHFEISKRLLNFQRSSEVCKIDLIFSDY